MNYTLNIAKVEELFELQFDKGIISTVMFYVSFAKALGFYYQLQTGVLPSANVSPELTLIDHFSAIPNLPITRPRLTSLPARPESASFKEKSEGTYI